MPRPFRLPLRPLLAISMLVVAPLSGCALRSNLFLQPAASGEGTRSCDHEPALDRPLKVANYNIKSGLWSSLDEIGAVLEGIDADVIALEEVDNGMERSGGVDQSAALAERLHAQRVFAASWERGGGSYGVALLSRVPVVGAERFFLPDVGGIEPRAAIDATVCAGAEPMRVVAAHSDFLPWAASAHAEALAERVSDSDSVLVMGDLNTAPSNDALGGFFRDGLKDVLALFVGDSPTFGDSIRLDYILTDHNVEDARIIDSDASDHRPVSALLRPLATGAAR